MLFRSVVVRHLMPMEVAATALDLGRSFPDLAPLDDESLLDEGLNHFADAFVQDSSDIFDGKRMVKEEITNGHISLGDSIQVRGIARRRKRFPRSLKSIS